MIVYIQIGVQNVTTVSTLYEQKEKSLFNYTHYKHKTKIGRERGQIQESGRVMEDLIHQPVV